MPARVHLAALVLAAALLVVPPAPARGEVWVLVDTESLTLRVLDDEQPVLELPGIAIGRGGADHDKLRGDQRTPLGRYKVAWFNPNSRFRFFIGLDYPRREQVERAFKAGDIGEAERDRLLRAIYRSRLPPQNTALGGQIGIHGLGAADPDLHAAANWTEGCVALTNEQIDQLRRWVEIGTTVVIR